MESSATMRARWRMTMWVQRRSTVSSSWELKRTTLPRAASSAMRLRRTSDEATSRPEKGSVEQDEVGVVHEGGGEEDLLAHALGVGGQRDVAVGVQAEEAKQAVDALERGCGGEVAELGDHDEVLEAAEVGVEVRLFGDVAEAAAEGEEVVADGTAVEEDVAGGGLEEAGDHLHGGGFAGAVGAEVAGDLAGVRGEADGFDGGDAQEIFVDAAELEHGGDLVPLCSILY